jgi:glycosyltransferase involved in cell wall biosynthesis
MRITIVLGAFFPVPPLMGGAVEKAWFALGREFARRGHEVVQISRTHPQLARSETIDGVKHVRVRGYDSPASLLWLKLLDLFYSLRVRAVLPPADIVVTNTFWLPILVRGLKHGALYVHVARYPKGQMRFYQHSARLQAPSQAIADAIAHEAPALAPKVAVISYPRPEVSAVEQAASAARQQKILYVGRLHPEKGVHLLIPAVPAGWKLVIVGPWQSRLGGGGEAYCEELRALAENSPGDVELIGPIFEADRLQAEFRSARLFVYPSLAEHGETFGLAALEAMAHGCAVVVSQLGCFRDFVREGNTGFSFDHRAADPARSLQRKLAEIVQDPGTLARVAAAGQRKSEEYDVRAVAEKFLQDFATLTATCS